MEADSSSTSDDANIQRVSSKKDTTEKQKLLREIEELKCIIKQCELHVDTVCFEDIEKHTTKFEIPTAGYSSRIPNIEVDLQNELYNFAGFNCIKFRRDEIVCHLMTTNELQENKTYAVQFFIKDGKVFLGKWVMPMSIDMPDILNNTPIDKLQDISAFLKNCQRHINCYITRQDQYLKLKDRTSDMKHCKLYSNTGYTQINLEMYNVNDIKQDTGLDLIIYIIYHSDEARPYIIDIDTINQNKLSSDRKQRLKVYLKQFKMLDLKTAFDQMLADNSEFAFIETDDNDCLLELNDISDSEEGFVEELLNKKTLRRTKKKRELQKKWKKTKQRDTSSFTASRNSIKYTRSKAKVTNVRKQKSTSKKKVEEVASTSNMKEATPFKQPEVKLRQKKLDFQAVQNKSSDNVNKKTLTTSNKPSGKSKIAKLVTSTPLIQNRNINMQLSSSSLSIGNISNIGRSEENFDKLKMTPRIILEKSISNIYSSRESPSRNKIIPPKRSPRLAQRMS